jgi:hypothetical protein
MMSNKHPFVVYCDETGRSFLTPDPKGKNRIYVHLDQFLEMVDMYNLINELGTPYKKGNYKEAVQRVIAEIKEGCQ